VTESTRSSLNEFEAGRRKRKKVTSAGNVLRITSSFFFRRKEMRTGIARTSVGCDEQIENKIAVTTTGGYGDVP